MSTERPERDPGPMASPEGPPAGKRRRAPAEDGLHIVGLTGGLASGKSTVARVLAQRGARLLEADRIGHEILTEPEVRDELVRVFGASILDHQGEVDRAALGRVVFADRDALGRLNAISHPRLLARLRRQLNDLSASGAGGAVVIDAALLVEWDLGSWCDEVIAVVAPIERRRAWAASALGLPAAEVERRFAAQLPDAERVRYADRVLVNEGTRADLERKASLLADSLLASGEPRGRDGGSAG